MSTVKSLPSSDRPRERLQRLGYEAVSTVELLAILLGSGTKNLSVLELATNLLSHFGTVSKLADASVEELCEVRGIGIAKAIQIQAAFAIGLRRENEKFQPLTRLDELYFTVQNELGQQKTEVLLVVLLDVKRRLIHREVVAKGTLSEIVLHPREVFHPAIKHRAHSLIIAHNHPSGDPTPSQADHEMTQLLFSTGKMIGIPLLDHLIIGKNNYYSFEQDRTVEILKKASL